MAIDNTHTKYLKGADKKAWEGYKDAYKAQQNLETFMGGLELPKDIHLKEGEVYDIPMRKKENKGK